jgi:hypothetical protein
MSDTPLRNEGMLPFINDFHGHPWDTPNRRVAINVFMVDCLYIDCRKSVKENPPPPVLNTLSSQIETQHCKPFEQSFWRYANKPFLLGNREPTKVASSRVAE